MCFLQIGELCKVISEELRMQEKVVPWKEWCGIRMQDAGKTYNITSVRASCFL